MRVAFGVRTMDKNAQAAAESTSPKAFLSDVKAVRERARQNIDEGAVTPNYPIDAKAVCEMLNGALATELVCVLRYKRHYFTAEGIESEGVKAEFKAHAAEEQGHADQLAKRIVELGGSPNLDPAGLATRSHSEYVAGTTLREMIKEDLIAERIAIETYREMINWLGDRDSTTRTMLEGILSLEEEHADDMSSLLKGLRD